MAFKILLVDDEQNALNGYKRTLQKYFDVQAATSGRQGLELIRHAGPFAVVVSDYVMPEMNGIEFLTEARKTAPATVRIMLTGYPDLEVAINAVNSGNIFYFLVKPSRPEELINTVIQGVEQYRAGMRLWKSPGTGGSPPLAAAPGDYFFLDSSDDQKNDYLRGKAYQYRGLHLWSAGKLAKAGTSLEQARAHFQEMDLPDEVARSSFYLAALLLQEYRTAVRGRDSQKNKIIVLLKEAITLSRDNAASLDLSQEKEYILPLLQWALTQDLKIADNELMELLRELDAEFIPSLYGFHIFTLGKFMVYRNDEVLDKQAWRNPKVEGLFRYLLAYRQTKKDRDKIMDAFWPDKDPKAASNNLSSSLYYLRQVFGRRVIRYEKGFCWLDSEQLRIDADVFERYIKTARNYRDNHDLKKSLAAYEEAFKLYQGDFLEEYDYDDWIFAERDRLQHLYQQALEEAAALLAVEEKYAQAVTVLEQGFRKNPCRPGLLQSLLQYLLILGRKEEALAHYHYSRQKHIEEYGVEIDSTLDHLFD